MGVWKKMPAIGATGYGIPHKGIEYHRQQDRYTMTDKLKSPFPWPGGKSDQAPAIWSRLGDVSNFVEPFAGSAAVLLARPHDLTGKTETANDVDGLLINALRCIQFAPDETAEWCDWPVSEADLTSRHLYLKSQRDELTSRLFADPLWCDPLAGAWWLWGIASWIGDGWCVADGPWINVDGRLVDRRVVGSDADGVGKKMPKIGGTTRAGADDGYTPLSIIEQYRASVPRKMPEVGSGRDRGTSIRGVQAYRHHAGVPRQMPNVTPGPYNTPTKRGIQLQETSTALAAYFARLSDRLRRVRFLCGDWKRAVKDSVTVNHGLTGVMLDSPYPQAEHSMGYHSEDGKDVWFESAQWAAEHGDDPRLRIAVCGYMSPACDAMFPPTWERLPWEARGGYANQSKDGRGRTNAKREMIWFSPNCIDAKTDYGPLFAGLEDV